MVTAMQAAKIRAANALVKAREEVMSTRSLICWKEGSGVGRELDSIVDRIDALIKEVVP